MTEQEETWIREYGPRVDNQLPDFIDKQGLKTKPRKRISDILPVSVDNSQLKFFPPIRHQGSLNSCVPFSICYYQLTYEVGKVLDWDNKNEDNSFKFSPKWIYNLINHGANSTTSWKPTYQMLMAHGCALWDEFPYEGGLFPESNYREWCTDPQVWRNALRYRLKSFPYIEASYSRAGLLWIKKLLRDGHILISDTYINSWQYKQIKDDLATAHDDSEIDKQCCYYVNNSQNYHSMTIVGYNDDLWIDINDNGQVDIGEKGALRLTNSWGTSWKDNGFIWLAYDALKRVSILPDGPNQDRRPALGRVFSMQVEVNKRPRMLAQFTLNHSKRSQLSVSLGLSDIDQTSPAFIWEPPALKNNGGDYAFDGTDHAVSMTFFMDFSSLVEDNFINTGVQKRWYLTIKDILAEAPATLETFKLIDVQGGSHEVTAQDLPQTVADNQVNIPIDYTLLSSASNYPPIVSAGPDREITYPENTVQLDGLVMDDGLPEDASLTASWSVISGSGQVGLSDPFSVHTTATFYDEDVYVLCLSINDSELQASDEVSITFNNDTTPVCIPACNVPEHLSARDITGTSASLSWYTVPEAETYQVQYKLKTSSAWIFWIDTPYSSVHLFDLLPDGEYEFKVQAQCPACYSDFSEPFFFTTIDICTVPQNVNANYITMTSADVYWDDIPAAVGYEYQYRETDDEWGGWSKTSQGNVYISGLQPSMSYEFMVKTNCEFKDSDPSAPITFKTLPYCHCGIPTEVLSDNITASSVDIYWSLVPDANQYYYQYRQASYNWNDLNNIPVEAPFTITDLSPGVKYELRLRAQCDTCLSDFSYPITFTTQKSTCECPEPINLKATQITSTSATISWEAVPRVVVYYTQYRIKDGLFSDWSKISDTSTILSNLQPGQTYEFRVYALCADDCTSKYSESETFTTNPSGLEVEISSPSDHMYLHSEIFPIEGSTIVYNFQGYELFSAPEDRPDETTLIISSTTPQSHGILAQWDIRNYTDGDYIIILKVRGEQEVIRQIKVTIDRVNQPPEMGYLKNLGFLVGQYRECKIEAFDPDDPESPWGQLKYSVNGLPSGASFDTSTGLFSWNPAKADEGDYTLVFRIQDDENIIERQMHIRVLKMELKKVSAASDYFKGMPAIWDNRIVWEEKASSLEDAPYAISIFDLTTDKILTLDEDSSDQRHPKIWNNLIIWSQRTEHDYTYYLTTYNLDTGATVVAEEIITSLGLSDMWEDRIVWADNAQVYLYEAGSNIKTLIESNLFIQYHPPAVWGDTIIWVEYNDLKRYKRICVYNMADESINYIYCSNPIGPNLALYKNRVIWTEAVDEFSPRYNLFIGELLEDSLYTIRSITEGTLDGESGLDIWEGKIVWSDYYKTGNYDIYLYDINEEMEYRITDGLSSQSNPKIYDNKIVWVDNNQDIYMGDVSSGFTITVDMDLNSGWSIISLPVETSAQINELFPEALAVFAFITKYEIMDMSTSLKKGIGYWIYIPEPKTYSVTGILFDRYTLLNASSGWSMIGSTSYQSRVSISAGSIKAMYSFTNEYISLGSGNEVGPLDPGKGFWINLSENTDIMVEKE